MPFPGAARPWEPSAIEKRAYFKLIFLEWVGFIIGAIVGFETTAFFFGSVFHRSEIILNLLVGFTSVLIGTSIASSRNPQLLFLPGNYPEDPDLTNMATKLAGATGGRSLRIRMGQDYPRPVLISKGGDMLIDRGILKQRHGTLRFVIAFYTTRKPEWQTRQYMLFATAFGLPVGASLAFGVTGFCALFTLLCLVLIGLIFVVSPNYGLYGRRALLDRDYRAFVAAGCSIGEAAQGMDLMEPKGYADTSRVDALRLRAEAVPVASQGSSLQTTRFRK